MGDRVGFYQDDLDSLPTDNQFLWWYTTLKSGRSDRELRSHTPGAHGSHYVQSRIPLLGPPNTLASELERITESEMCRTRGQALCLAHPAPSLSPDSAECPVFKTHNCPLVSGPQEGPLFELSVPTQSSSCPRV